MEKLRTNFKTLLVLLSACIFASLLVGSFAFAVGNNTNEEVKTNGTLAVAINCYKPSQHYTEYASFSVTPSGAEGSCQYQYYINDVLKQDWTPSTYYSFKPESPGTYIFKVNAKDDGGNTATNTFEYTAQQGDIDVSNISLSNSELYGNIGEKQKLTATVYPETATHKEVTWSSGNEDIAKVDQDGNVEFVSAGSTYITCQSVSNTSVSNNCSIYVTDPSTPITAVYNRLQKSLTFYYDKNSHEESGSTVYIAPFESAQRSDIPWANELARAESVVFDNSINNCYNLKSTAYWFAGESDSIPCKVSSFTNLSYILSYSKQVANTSHMFENCAFVQEISFQNMSTCLRKVQDFSSMFKGCISLQNLVSFSTSSYITSGKYFSSLFERCSAIKIIDFTNFKFPYSGNLEKTDKMFADCISLETICSSDTISPSGDSTDMFRGCVSLSGNKGTLFDATKIDKTYARLDGGASNPGYFSNKQVVAVYAPNTKSLTFYYDYKVPTVEGEMKFDVPSYVYSRESIPWKDYLGNIETVAFDNSLSGRYFSSMNYWFAGESLENPSAVKTLVNVDNLWISSGSEFVSTFAYCKDLTEMSFGNNTSFSSYSLVNAEKMFLGCSSLQKVSLCGNSTYYSRIPFSNCCQMFEDCVNLSSSDVDRYNLENCVNTSNMFKNAKLLTSFDFTNTSFDKLNNCSNMFNGCSALTTISTKYQVDFNSITSLTNSENMFLGCTKLKGDKGTNYDANHVDVVYAKYDGGSASPGYFTQCVPTVVYDQASQSLTFHYDSNKYTGTGVYVVPLEINSRDDIPWRNDLNNVVTAYFDPSFCQKFQPATTAYWFAGESNTKPCLLTSFASTEESTSSTFDNSKVNDFKYMFSNCVNMTTPLVSYFSPSAEIVDCTGMYEGCSSLNYNCYIPPVYTSCKSIICDKMYKNCSNLQLQNLAIPWVTTSCEEMFYGCTSLDSFEFSNLTKTRNFTNVKAMFKNCTNLSWVNLNNFEVSGELVQGGLEEMFAGCSSLTTIYNSNMLDLSFFSGDTYSKNMFAGCTSLLGYKGTVYDPNNIDATYARIDFGQEQPGYFSDLAKVVYDSADASLTFYYDTDSHMSNTTTVYDVPTSGTPAWNSIMNKVKTINIDPSFKAFKPECTSFWFAGTYSKPSSVESINNIENIDTSKTKNMSGMFSYSPKLTSIDLSHFNTSSAVILSSIFLNCSGLTSLDVSKFDTSHVTSFSGMFSGCSGIRSINLSNFVTAEATSLDSMFSGCSSLESFDISRFNTSNVTSIYYMFHGCEKLTSIDLSNKDFSNVEIAFSLFAGCKNLKTIKLPSDMSSLYTIEAMFSDCKSLQDVDLNFNSENLYYVYNLFSGCESLKNVNFGNSVFNVKTYSYVFRNCKSLENIDISCFSLEKAIEDPNSFGSLNCMFEGCENLKTIYVKPGTDLSSLPSAYESGARNTFEGCLNIQGSKGSLYDSEKTDASYAVCDGLNGKPGFFTAKGETPTAHKVTVDLDGGAATTIPTGWAAQGSKYVKSFNDGADYAKIAAQWNTAGLTKEGCDFDGFIPSTGKVSADVTLTANWIDVVNKAVAVFDDYDNSMYFYYDDEDHSEEGIVYDIPTNITSKDDIPWKDKLADVESIEIDTTFKKYSPKTTAWWFDGASKIETIKSLTNLNTASVTNMQNMFANCTKLEMLDLSNFNTSKVQNMSNMFNGDVAYKAADISGFNTSECKNFDCMFKGCKSLTDINVTGFDTSKATSLGGMFIGCTGLTKLDLGHFDISSITSENDDNAVGGLRQMFSGCTNLVTLYNEDNTDWTSKAGKVSADMFKDCKKLTGGKGTTYNANKVDASMARVDGLNSKAGYLSSSVPVGVVNTTNHSLTFYYDKKNHSSEGNVYKVPETINSEADVPWLRDKANFNKIKFNASFVNYKPITTAFWFAGCSLQTLDLTNLNTSQSADMQNMFANTTAINTLDLSTFDLTNVKNINSMFAGSVAQTIKLPTNSHTNNLQQAEKLFDSCVNLASVNFDVVNTENLKSMSSMFSGCQNLTSINLTSINTKSVTDMSKMFNGCTKLSSLDLARFNTSKVTNMSEMFAGCASLTVLDLSAFNFGALAKVGTEQLSPISKMFNNCSELTTINCAGETDLTKFADASNGVFLGDAKLIGGAGTKYNAAHASGDYARIDEGEKSPGYFTVSGKPVPKVDKVTYSSIALKWFAVQGATKYAVATQNSDGTYKTYTNTLTTNSYTISGLSEDTTYKCLVQAYVDGKWSEFTEADLLSVKTNPTKPKVEPGETGDGYAYVSWAAIPDATKYAIAEMENGTYRNYTTEFTGTTYKCDNLANGYEHYILVQAYVDGKWSSFTKANYCSVWPEGPEKPTATVKSVTDHSVTVSWAKVAGTTEYAAAVKDNTGKYTSVFVGPDKLEATIDGLTDSTSYQCLVQSKIYGAWTKFTDEDFVMAVTKGNRPVPKVVTEGDGYADIKWDAIEGATKYAVATIENGQFKNYSTTCTQTSYHCDNLANGYSHYLLVQAFVDGKWSPFTQANYLTVYPTGRTKPTTTVDSSTDHSVILSWDNIPGATDYAAAVRTPEGRYVSVYTKAGDETKAEIMGLYDKTNYKAIVQCKIFGQWSTFKDADMKDATTISNRPKVSQKEIGDGYATVEWPAIEGATKYAIAELENGTFRNFNTEFTGTVYKCDNLANGYGHNILVQAYVNGFWSQFDSSNYLLVTPQGKTKPEPVVSETTSSSITLTWAKVAGSQQYAAAVRMDDGSYKTVIVDANTTSATITGLQPGKTYQCLVQCKIYGAWSKFTQEDFVPGTTKTANNVNSYVNQPNAISSSRKAS